MAYVIAVDIGGTFTDLVAFDHETGSVLFAKSPTTYDNFVDGIQECMRKARVAPADARFVNHGTTLVINAIIQRRGNRAALVTTRGFRDVLEIARGNRPDPFDLHYQRDEPLIPRERRYEVSERIGADGSVVTALDTGELRGLARDLKAQGIEAVAVSFMNAYANPQHEERAVAELAELLPGVYVTGGTELCREWYEYERTATVAANAYVGPQVSTYVRRLDDELRTGGFSGTLFMMGSNGGVLSADRSCRQPISLVESGPIGGCIGAAAYAEALGYDNVISFDMGGTTAKCALVENGRFSVDSVYYAGGYIQGFPIKAPVIDVIEVGSGGGSIAWLDEQNRLHVGPRSAGSTPGPVCYGRGGKEPTVTDANLLLGRLAPDRFLGGELMLEVETAKAALLENIAPSLGYTGDDGAVELADGILSIATVVMAGAIRRQTIEHGRDPRDFVLFSYGGGGPLHAVALAHELSIPTVVIPPEPGNFSATGMLLADARLDTSETFAGVLDEGTVAAMGERFQAMEAKAAEDLREEIGVGEVMFERAAEMRYRGQRHNIKVTLPALEGPAEIRAIFDRDYERRYGHADTRAAAEIQALHLSAFAKLRRPDLAGLYRSPGGTDGNRGTRPVYFSTAGGWTDANIYERYELAPGFKGEGPAIIEEYGATTVVWPGDSFEIGLYREIRIRCSGTESSVVATRQAPSAVHGHASMVAMVDGHADGHAVDPITLEVIRHGIVSINDQIDANMTRTAFSPYIYEYKDYAVGMTDADGRLIAQCNGGMPIFVADAVGAAVRDGLKIYGKERLHHGDVVLCNHAAVQGQHLNNTVMYTPIFAGPDGTGELIGFMAINCHWIDIGGNFRSLGGGDIFSEGLQLRTVKLWSKGEPIQEVYRVIENNTRFPIELMGDIEAQLGGCLLGRDLTVQLAERFGLDTYHNALEVMLDQCETAIRKRIAAIPDGTYEAESFLDNDGVNDRRLPIKVQVVVEGTEVTVDYTDMPGEVEGRLNSGRQGGGVTTARVAFMYLIARGEPANEGTFRPLKLILPDGKLVSAGPTAPMQHYGFPFPTIIDTIIKALQTAMPEQATGAHFGTYSSVGFFGHRPNGAFFNCHDSAHGGWGACATHDGAGPFRSMAHGDTRIIPMELQETIYPYRYEELSLREDSSGPGRYRGGFGFRKQYRILAPCQLWTNFDRIHCLPWGVLGGMAGKSGQVSVYRNGATEPEIHYKTEGVPVEPGDLVLVEAGGGGGYGPPTDRPAGEVALDVRRGYVSEESALRDYGVSILPDGTGTR